MDIFLIPLLKVLMTVGNFLLYIILTRVVLSWLLIFGIVNAYSNIVSMINEFSYRMTEPFYSPLRRLLPNVGGFDLAPMVLILIIYFLSEVCQNVLLSLMNGS